jgi:hypothetical protein
MAQRHLPTEEEDNTAEEFGEGGSGQTIRRDSDEENEHGQALAKLDVRDLLKEAEVPASGGALVLLWLLLSEEKRQLERLGQADEMKLGGGRQGFGDVLAV